MLEGHGIVKRFSLQVQYKQYITKSLRLEKISDPQVQLHPLPTTLVDYILHLHGSGTPLRMVAHVTPFTGGIMEEKKQQPQRKS